MYDYRGVLDQRAKARKEAVALEFERGASNEEVFHHYTSPEILSRMRQKASAAVPEREQPKEEPEESQQETEVTPSAAAVDDDDVPNDPKASSSLDVLAEEL